MCRNSSFLPRRRSAFHPGQASDLAAYDLAHQQCEEDEISKRLHPLLLGTAAGGKLWALPVWECVCLFGSRFMLCPNRGSANWLYTWGVECWGVQRGSETVPVLCWGSVSCHVSMSWAVLMGFAVPNRGPTSSLEAALPTVMIVEECENIQDNIDLKKEKKKTMFGSRSPGYVCSTFSKTYSWWNSSYNGIELDLKKICIYRSGLKFLYWTVSIWVTKQWKLRFKGVERVKHTCE